MDELQSLSNLFINKLFRVPDYQRGYAWQKQQLSDFWEDIVNLKNDRNYYLGLLSLKEIKETEIEKIGNDVLWLLEKGFKAYHIVDGQQRLTTIVILLNEIINIVCDHPNNTNKTDDLIVLNYESIKDIRKKYISIECPPDGLIVTYLFCYDNGNSSADYLKYKVLGQEYGGSTLETYYTKNLKYAKEFFKKELHNYLDKRGIEGIEELYKKLILNLKFNIYEIDDNYDVFVAFEAMNNRGKKLSNLELLKNRLIYLTTLYSKDVLNDANEEALRNLINTVWKEVYYQLGRNDKQLLSDDDFLKAHWIIYYSYSRQRGDDYIKFLLRKFSHKSIFDNLLEVANDEEDTSIAIVNHQDDDDDDDIELMQNTDINEFLEPKEIQDYVNSLNELAGYWYYTYFPDQYNDITEEEQLWIENLNHIGIAYFRPMVAVSLIPRLKFKSNERISFYKAIERFIFIKFRMAMSQSSYKSSYYYGKTREIYSEKITLSDVTKDLMYTTNENIDDSVETFILKMNARFTSQDGFYNWKALKYFLFEYEFSLASHYKLEKLSWGMLTKVVKDEVTIEHILPQKPTKPYWCNAFKQYKSSEIKTLSASLGNMLPLSQSINSKLQNDSFDEKKARGYLNGCHCEIEVAKEDNWTAKNIYDRGMKLLNFMEERWNFNFKDEQQKEELLHLSFIKS